MDGGEVHLEARMLLEPSPNLLALVHAEVVADQVDQRDGLGRLVVDLLQQLDD